MTNDVVVVALGASTPLGRGARVSAAAVRAGISGFVEHPLQADSAGAPVRAAIAPWLDIGLRGAARFEALLFSAMDEALTLTRPGLALERPLVMAAAIGLPEPRPGVPADLQPQLMRSLARRYGSRFASAACFEGGHAAGLLALRAAIGKLQQGGLDACVVAGVDSWIDRLALEWLEEREQLHSAGAYNNAWGFIPGEGAGALLLMRSDTAEALQLPTLTRVLAVGVAHEFNRIKTQTVCIGEGLTEAFRQALAALPARSRVSDIYCDMNGEPYRADEFGFAALRTKEHFESASDFVAPADCWGDVAAAGGVLHLVLASAATHGGYARGPLAFVWASAQRGDRVAALLVKGGTQWRDLAAARD